MNDDAGRQIGSKRIRESLLAAKDLTDRDRQELYEFGPFRLEPAERKLWRGNGVVVLTPKAFDTLVLLVRNSGHLLEKDELIRVLWPDSFVEEGNLTNNISLLRKALGESPPYIETVPKRGYRFIGAVRQLPKTVPTGQEGQPAQLEVASEVIFEKRRSVGTVTMVSSRPATATKWKIGAGVLLAILAVAVTGGLLWRSRQAQRLSDKDTIVLADFTNSTGDPVFDDALKQGLRVQLEQSPFLNILSDQKIAQELQLMGRARDERLTVSIALEVCQRAGSKLILAGSIASLGTHYAVGLNALNCKTGDEMGSAQAEADSRERVLNALSESAASIRKKLGESRSTIEKYDAPVEVTTPSLEALKAYSLGMKTWFAKGDTPSLSFFKQAVELDPKFSMAYARLAMVYDNIGERALVIENMKKAHELGENVSEWERLYIKAHYYDRVTGEVEKAVQTYEMWQQIYPRDWVPHNNLRGFYALFGNYETALEEGREALRLGPDIEDNYWGLGYVYIALNRIDDADAVFKQAADRKLESGGLLWGRYLVAFLRDDTKDLQGLALSAASDPISRVNLLLWTGRSLGDHGKLSAARDMWQREAKSAENSKAEWADLLQAVTASMEAYWGDVQRARAHANAVTKATLNREAAVTAVYALAVAGDINGARKQVAELERRFPTDTLVKEYWLPTIRATLALDRKSARAAVELLRAASPYELGTMGRMEPVYIRGQAYLMLRDGSAAAAEFQKILDHRTIVQLNPTGVFAHLGLARAWALEGDTTKASAKYQDILRFWKDADPDVPILKQVKAEYAKLQ